MKKKDSKLGTAEIRENGYVVDPSNCRFLVFFNQAIFQRVLKEETSKMLFLVVLFMFVAAAHGCSCKQEPLKKKFCEADYVSYVVIKKEDTSKLNGRDGIRIYEVEHKEVYKQPEGMQELPNNVTTPEHGAGCGVRLWVGEQFLIGVEPVRIFLGFCLTLHAKQNVVKARQT
ncbi:hypothetical protein ANCCEY_06316 [Ancylostoma ceylanicum]|uniref:NTR domain-containing protein n=1 Tax=Ancylostoma ceylanicum TaxID=53326 RepID=A0A0D6LWV9_9BILA|nr:hypothetical protein ANCCEY_06316 [Ancylostoma ceylanicum]